MRPRIHPRLILLTLVAFLVSFLATNASAVRDQDGKWSTLDVGSTKPSARKHHTMIYDPVHKRVILYGGETEVSEQQVLLNDLWELDLDGSSPQWTELTPSNGPSTGRHGHSAAYDATNDRMLIVNGRKDFGAPGSSSFPIQVWALSLGSGSPSWSELDSLETDEFKACPTAPGSCLEPYALRTHSAAACLTTGLFVMGGQAGTGQYAMEDTWQLPNSADWAYESGGLFPIVHGTCEPCLGTIPDRRYWHIMITDTGYDRLVVFGGFYPDGGPGNVSNTFVTSNGETWTDLGDAPTGQGGGHNFARMFHAAVYDEAGDRMVVVGGYQSHNSGVPSSITDAVTTLDLPGSLDGDWALLEPDGTGPGDMAEHAAVYDVENDRMIVFGGVDENGDFITNSTYVLEFADQTPPAAATLSGFRGKTTATISWTAPGDDGTVGTASAYDLRRSTSTITEGNFASATQISTSAPQSAGSDECAQVSGLSACQTYYYALKTSDAAGNWSALSNVLSLTQKCSGGEVICDGGGLGPVAVLAMPQMVEYAIRGANPTSGLTTLFVGIPSDRQGESMEISIFDVTGARIRTLTRGAATVGEQEFAWDHRSHSGAAVAVGVYFARLQLGNETRTHKIVVSSGR